MKKQYRCIVVTLPNFGKKDNPRSWGVELAELVRILCEQIEKYSKKKQVTLVIHDWGSILGFMVQTARPDLVSRIATIDLAGDFPTTCNFKAFELIYQGWIIFLFLLGEPVGGCFLRLTLGPALKHLPPSEIKSQKGYPYFYRWFGKRVPGHTPYNLDPVRCPVFFAYGSAEFHTK